jgi:uncharacterized DUF497 family protein
MEMEFDSRKDAANLDKHGLSLADATLLDWDTLLAMEIGADLTVNAE